MGAIASVVTILGNVREVFGIVSSVVAGVEAIGAAVAATGREKRRLAIERARAQLQEVDLNLSTGILGAVVDVVVWVGNTLLGKSWSETVQIEVSQAREAVGDAAEREGEDPTTRMAELEQRARDEFARIEAGRDGP